MDFSDEDIIEAIPYPNVQSDCKQTISAQLEENQEKTRKFIPGGLKLGKKKTQTQVLCENNLDSIEERHNISCPQSLQFRKKLPVFQQVTSDIEEEPIEVTQRPEIVKESKQLSLNMFMRKNFKPEKTAKAQISKINEIKQCNKVVSCRGQVIFSWEKQKINEKWAKTDMVCIEIYDGTGSIMVAIPQKHHNKLKQELKLDQWVEITGAQTREKYPKTICLLVSEKSKVQIYKKGSQNQISCEPQKLGITIKQLQIEPIGSTCNLVCMILAKENKQFIKSSKGNELVLTHIRVYDPRDKKQALIKLWEQKTDINFFPGLTVYLLKGIEVKQYKGQRQYDSNKEFTFRSLSYSGIQNYLRPFLEVNQALLHKITKNKKQTLPHTPRNMMIFNQGQLSYKKREEIVLDSTKIEWNTNYVRLIGFYIDCKLANFYSLCARCGSRVMIDQEDNAVCFTCGYKKGEKHYALKFQYSDQLNVYQGQIRDSAAQKLLTLGSEPMNVEFFQQSHFQFRRRLIEEISGNVVKGVFATITHKLSQHIQIKSNFLVDIMPYDSDSQDEGSSILSQNLQPSPK